MEQELEWELGGGGFGVLGAWPNGREEKKIIIKKMKDQESQQDETAYRSSLLLLFSFVAKPESGP